MELVGINLLLLRSNKLMENWSCNYLGLLILHRSLSCFVICRFQLLNYFLVLQHSGVLVECNKNNQLISSHDRDECLTSGALSAGALTSGTKYSRKLDTASNQSGPLESSSGKQPLSSVLPLADCAKKNEKHVVPVTTSLCVRSSNLLEIAFENAGNDGDIQSLSM